MSRITVLGSNASEYYDTDDETGEWKAAGTDLPPEGFEGTIRKIAIETMNGHPPLGDEALMPVARFYGIDVQEVTFTHVACYKQAVEAAKGDMNALTMLVGYAGSIPKPRQKR